MWTNNPQIYIHQGWGIGFDEQVGTTGLHQIGERVFNWETHIRKSDRSKLLTNAHGILKSIVRRKRPIKSLRQRYDIFTRPAYDGGSEVVLRRLNQTEFGDREFCFINLMDCHTPYYPPREGKEPITVTSADGFADTVSNPDDVRRAYDRSAQILSNRYEQIHKRLRQDFDWVITLSDHGELLGEHGHWNHEFGVYPELVHVPLHVSGEDVGTGVSDQKVDLLDVHATILDLANVSADTLGSNILRGGGERDTLVEYGGRIPFHQRLLEREDVSKDAKRAIHTELAGVATPDGEYYFETSGGVYDRSGKSAPSTQSRIEKLVESIEHIKPANSGTDFPDQVMDQLKDLGYA